MLDMKFSGTVDFGAKVTKFGTFSLPRFGVFLMRCHAVFVLVMVAQLRLDGAIVTKLLIIADEFYHLNMAVFCLLGERSI